MMNMTDDDSMGVMARPARGRELKSRTLPIQVDLPASHLSWGAGVESMTYPQYYTPDVASLAGCGS